MAMIRKILTALALALPGVAHADWYEASTPHFVVYSSANTKELGGFATRLERYDKALRVRFKIPDEPVGDANRVTVFVLGDVDEIQDLAGSETVAGFYRPGAGDSVAFTPRRTESGQTALSSQAILLHEYAHHFMLSTWAQAAFPAWFIEGFAECYATARFEPDGSIVLGDPPQYRGGALFDGALLTVERMLAAQPDALSGEMADVFYGRGWLLTHYLTFSGKRRGQLAAYVAAINAGTPPVEAGRAAFGDLKTLDRELDHYLREQRPALRVAATALDVGAPVLRKLGPGEAAMMRVRIGSRRGVSDRTAPALYAVARKTAEPFPDDEAVQLALAEAAYDARAYAASDAAATRAATLDPKAVAPPIREAMARIEIARHAGDWKPATWNAIRATIGIANRIDPDDPRPLILYYDSFVAQGLAPIENAKAGLRFAAALAPQDTDLRLKLGLQQLNDGQTAVARATLVPVAYNPHGGSAAKLVRKIVAALDKGDAKEAQRLLKDADKPEEKPAPGKPSGA